MSIMQDSVNTVKGYGAKIGIALGVLLLAIVLFNGIFVYNEAGYQTHVRTIFGEEKVITEVGYATKWFGRATPWKQAQTVQFIINDQNSSGDESSGTVKQYKIVFLGNVDADVEASTRFRLPQGEQFLKIAREYRTPDNFVATALTPAIKETLQSTASLMSADDYFAGARSEFGSEFENQLRMGQYVTSRKEVQRKQTRNRDEGAKLVSGAGAENEETSRTMFVTEKLLDSEGLPRRKHQQFIGMGVEVVEARITNIVPNGKYLERMQKVQDSLGELAIARQNRLKEEEAKLLVIAQGQKNVEEKRQSTLREQIEQTTKAETEKMLAIINADREREKAEIEKVTAALQLDKAKIDALSTKTLADAEAYAKEAVIKADGALDKKLDALVKINRDWADAASKAPVPSVMMGGSSDGTGRQNEMTQLMQVMAVKAAKDLQIDMNVKK